MLGRQSVLTFRLQVAAQLVKMLVPTYTNALLTAPEGGKVKRADRKEVGSSASGNDGGAGADGAQQDDGEPRLQHQLSAKAGGKLAGMVFVITGHLETMER